VQKAADAALGVARQDDEAVRVRGRVEPVHCHREAALRRAVAPALGDPLQLGHSGLVELAERLRLGAVAGARDTVDRLADLLDCAALKREPVGRDDRLIADVERAQAGLLVEIQQPVARPHGGHLQPAALGEVQDGAQHARQRVVGAHGIAGQHEHPRRDATAGEAAPVVGEEVAAILAQIEVGQRVLTMSAHEICRQAPHPRRRGGCAARPRAETARKRSPTGSPPR
jgi:hypothetical protein